MKLHVVSGMMFPGEELYADVVFCWFDIEVGRDKNMMGRIACELNAERVRIGHLVVHFQETGLLGSVCINWDDDQTEIQDEGQNLRSRLSAAPAGQLASDFSPIDCGDARERSTSASRNEDVFYALSPRLVIEVAENRTGVENEGYHLS
jgi:hypothetical protein